MENLLNSPKGLYGRAEQKIPDEWLFYTFLWRNASYERIPCDTHKDVGTVFVLLSV